nr:hypothetical protein [Tanacetum cinerariifolium]
MEIFTYSPFLAPSLLIATFSSTSTASAIRPLFLIVAALRAEALELMRAYLALTLLYLALKSLVGLSSVIMTKVIKEGLEKFESSDDSFACNTSLEVFQKEFNRLNNMDDDLFTYEVEIPELANILCNLKEEDDLEQRMTHGSDMFLLKILRDSRLMTNTRMIGFINGIRMYHGYMKNYGRMMEHGKKSHLLNIIANLLITKVDFWNGQLIVGRMMDIVNGGKLPGACIVGNSLNYQDLKWYEALKDGELKDEALRNKAIVEGIINEDDESSNDGWRKWDDYENTIHYPEERCKDTTYDALVCKIKR